MVVEISVSKSFIILKYLIPLGVDHLFLRCGKFMHQQLDKA